MPSQTLLAQADFSTLGLADTDQDANIQLIEGYNAFAMDATIKVPGDAPSKFGSSTSEMSTYKAGVGYSTPLNFIPDEVYGFIRNREMSWITWNAANSINSESFITNARVLEPIRYLVESAAPPKLFFRTFWRSLTRRLVKRTKALILTETSMSNSDATDKVDGPCTSRASH
jgi:hypothetical protein